VVNLLQQLFNAASDASVYAICAAGLSIVFGLSRIVNLAYGDFLTLGAYVVFIVAPAGAIGFIWGFGVAAVVVGVLCIIFYRLLFRFTLVRPVNGFLISLGLTQIIENGLAWHYTENPVTVAPANAAVWNVGGVLMSADRVIIIVGTIIILAILVWFLERTRTGLSIRAVATDRETASLMGVPVTRVIAGVFALGGVLAGMGGAFVALLEPPTPLLGAELILKGFVIALVGGLGNVRGAILGAIALAVVETVLITVGLSAWLDAIEFGAVIVLLLFRPQGLIGGVEHSI
jgi:branched-chain amino acid transport system permease protein